MVAYTLDLSALKQAQSDSRGFETSVVYRASSSATRATQRETFLKRNKGKKKKRN